MIDETEISEITDTENSENIFILEEIEEEKSHDYNQILEWLELQQKSQQEYLTSTRTIEEEQIFYLDKISQQFEFIIALSLVLVIYFVAKFIYQLFFSLL